MHTAGLGELVARSLRVDVGARVRYADDSAILIETSASADRLAALVYVKNCFLVVGSIPRPGQLPQAVEAAARQVPRWELKRTGRPFRLMFFEDGKLAGVPGTSRDKLQAALTRATGGRFNPRGGVGDEFWMITRRDLDEVLLAQRVDRPPTKPPAKGSLAPDLAALLVHTVGPPRPSDVVLDPFAGSGALIFARTSEPFRNAICSDLGYGDGDGDGTVQVMPELARKPRVQILSEDARTLVGVLDASIDVIVTDPPWGEFARIGSTEGGTEERSDIFFAETLASIARVLRPGGRIAMLLSRRLATEVQGQWDTSGLDLHQAIDLLVNGHPATILVGSRNESRTDL